MKTLSEMIDSFWDLYEFGLSGICITEEGKRRGLKVMKERGRYYVEYPVGFERGPSVFNQVYGYMWGVLSDVYEKNSRRGM